MKTLRTFKFRGSLLAKLVGYFLLITLVPGAISVYVSYTTPVPSRRDRDDGGHEGDCRVRFTNNQCLHE